MEFGLMLLLDKHNAAGEHSHHAMDLEAEYDSGNPKVLCLVCDELMSEQLLRQHCLTQRHLAGLSQLRERHVVDLSFQESDSYSIPSSSRDATPEALDARFAAAQARKAALESAAAAEDAADDEERERVEAAVRAAAAEAAQAEAVAAAQAKAAAATAAAEAQRVAAAQAKAAAATAAGQTATAGTAGTAGTATSPVRAAGAAASARASGGPVSAGRAGGPTAGGSGRATAPPPRANAGGPTHRGAPTARLIPASASKGEAAAGTRPRAVAAATGPAQSAADAAAASTAARASAADARLAERKEAEAARAAEAAAWLAERAERMAAAAAASKGVGGAHCSIEMLPPLSADPARNPGVALNSKAWAWLQGAQVNRPALELRIETHKTRRTVKKKWQLGWLLRAVACMDLTTLAGDDTWGNVSRLCFKANAPLRTEYLGPLALGDRAVRVAAVCIYPARIADAVKTLASIGASDIPIASVAAGFPASETPLATRVAETQEAIALGASEIDVVIARDLVIGGKWTELYAEIRTLREVCGDKARLKVILAVGELPTLRDVYKASLVAMFAGADFIKTSTGKEALNATLPVGLVMLRAIRDYHDRTGFRVGFKPAGGIRSAKDATVWLSLVVEELGEEWARPALFRIGASTLITDIERQIGHGLSSHYGADHYEPMP